MPKSTRQRAFSEPQRKRSSRTVNYVVRIQQPLTYAAPAGSASSAFEPPVVQSDQWVHQTAEDISRATQDAESKRPRVLNPFFCYMASRQAAMKRTGNSHGICAKACGEEWNELPESTKEVWRTVSAKHRLQHATSNPELPRLHRQPSALTTGDDRRGCTEQFAKSGDDHAQPSPASAFSSDDVADMFFPPSPLDIAPPVLACPQPAACNGPFPGHNPFYSALSPLARPASLPHIAGNMPPASPWLAPGTDDQLATAFANMELSALDWHQRNWMDFVDWGQFNHAATLAMPQLDVYYPEAFTYVPSTFPTHSGDAWPNDFGVSSWMTAS